jgi:hypothetical protein
VKIKIDEYIKENARRCEKNYACLSNENHKLCKVEHTVGNDLFFIECIERDKCTYRVGFGYSSYLCTCPIRKEIYRKYKI